MISHVLIGREIHGLLIGYMGKPVGSRFGQISGKKIQDRYILSQIRVYHLHKSAPSTEKRPRKPETGIKDGFEEMEHEFLFRTFRLEKQDYFFRNFPLKRPEKSCSIYPPAGCSGKVFVNGKQPV